MSRPAPTLGRTGLRPDDLGRVRLRLLVEHLPAALYIGLHRELAASILLRALDDLAEPRHARLAGRRSRLHTAAVQACAFLARGFERSVWAEWLGDVPADRLRALVAREAAETAARVPTLRDRLAAVVGPLGRDTQSVSESAPGVVVPQVSPRAGSGETPRPGASITPGP